MTALRPRPPTSLSLLAAITLAVFLGSGASAEPPAGEDDGRPPRFAPGERERLEEAGQGLARHLVRVRIEVQPVIHRVDGLKIHRPWVLEGTCGGLVVAPDPLVLISGSSCRPDHAGMSFGLAAGLKDPPKRRYTLLLAGGEEVPAVIRRRDRSINVLLLAPASDEALPDAVPPPVSFEGLSRPRSGELLGVVSFITPAHADRVHVVPNVLQPGRDHYARPVLLAAGLHQLGMPVFFSDGRLAGLVNIPPPEDAAPRPRLDPEAAADTDGTRDPLEWATGYRRPVLMSRGDLAPFVESLYAPAANPVPFAPLGLSVREDGSRLRIDSVDPGGPAARAGLIAGEVIARVGGHDVATVEEFEEAFGRAHADGDGGLDVVVLRDERPVEIVLAVE